ncbi:hypothetical protein P3X46_030915 [Hevea brasiliensis]|uniref:Cytochrome P450 n=1 Tax=Hevea brasiliensis TaxID=3981 RepID=A0ABQ9KIM5_HEVBR|nr:cytochrome P450 736A117 [Hevea brasiliensis]KAJ9140243.1 hypothetical protein P3X46_030915 [Hevea brasiliensis]
MLQFFINGLPLFFFFFFFFISFLVLKWLLNPPIQKNLPPSPPKLPILGNLHQLGLYPHRSLRSLAQCYGPLMQLRFGSIPVLVASSADVAREIMKTHDLTFSNRPKFNIADKLLYGGQDVSTAPYGEYWRQMRSICVLQLLSTKRVQSFRSVREEEIAIFAKKIKESAYLSSPVNLSETFASLTNDIVCRVALGRKYSEGKSGKKFKELLGEFMELLGTFTVGDFIPWLGWVNGINGFDAKVEKISKEFDTFLDEVVEEHMDTAKRRSNANHRNVESEDKKNFVDVLLKLQEDNMAGFSMTKVNIKALILDMFAAGTDTTYTVLEWAMSELLRHPRVMKEVQNEVRRIGNGKAQITEGDLDQMNFLKAVIKETLRLYPPIPLLVPRVSTQDVKIKGYDVVAGSTVFTNAWAIGRDPKRWDQPEEFRPERFLNSSIDFKGHDFELIPFGGGRRGCPGILFAMTTNELVLANLVNQFNWALPGGASGKDLDMTECPGLTIHRKFPLLAIATPRP